MNIDEDEKINEKLNNICLIHIFFISFMLSIIFSIINYYLNKTNIYLKWILDIAMFNNKLSLK